MTAPPTRPEAVLFDLDGTIVDTMGFLFDAFRHAVAPFVSRLPSNAEVVATFGPAERECIARYLKQAEQAGTLTSTDPERVNQAVERFFRFYERGHDQIRAFPGMIDLIQTLHRAGVPLGVFTGKGRRGAEYTLGELGLWPGVLRCLVSSDDITRVKPDPEGVLKAVERLNVPAEATLFVGDAPADILAGRAAKTRTAAALWGSFDHAATLAAEPTLVFYEVAQLRDLLLPRP